MSTPKDDRRARILALTPEDRAQLAEFMARQRDKIPAQIADLQAAMRDHNAWLAEFAPELAKDDLDAATGTQLCPRCGEVVDAQIVAERAARADQEESTR